MLQPNRLPQSIPKEILHNRTEAQPGQSHGSSQQLPNQERSPEKSHYDCCDQATNLPVLQPGQDVKFLFPDPQGTYITENVVTYAGKLRSYIVEHKVEQHCQIRHHIHSLGLHQKHHLYRTTTMQKVSQDYYTTERKQAITHSNSQKQSNY